MRLTMVDSLMPAWMSRAINHGPRLVSCVLVIVIAAECARAALPLLDRYPRGSRAPTPAGASHSQWTSGIDTPSIVAAHLFGVSAPEEAGDPAAATPTAASLVLDGTFATDDARRGMAIITDAGAAKVYRVGDEVEGAALQLVYRDRVILARGGRFESLSLRKLAASDSAEPTPAPETTAGAQALADIMTADASTDESDHILGFRLRASGTARAEFFRSGLRPGDLLTGVNGTSLTDQDPQRSQEIVHTMLTSGRATVSVVRNGKPVDVSVDLSTQ
jgi:general secretion pathway protein C